MILNQGENSKLHLVYMNVTGFVLVGNIVLCSGMAEFYGDYLLLGWIYHFSSRHYNNGTVASPNEGHEAKG